MVWARSRDDVARPVRQLIKGNPTLVSICRLGASTLRDIPKSNHWPICRVTHSCGRREEGCVAGRRLLNKMLPPGNHACCTTLHTNYLPRPILHSRDTVSAKAHFSGRQPLGQSLHRASTICKAVSAPDIPLDRMQMEKLQAALAHGRKRISVSGASCLI